ncbi:hypothetical protein AGR1A_pAt20514 [Agrobacterium fabacearum CFBP 5771]|nr:hypothetical protein AGR1A_pAt20514 [Agrobacterium fabacearum CFBP 5771]
MGQASRHISQLLEGELAELSPGAEEAQRDATLSAMTVTAFHGRIEIGQVTAEDGNPVLDAEGLDRILILGFDRSTSLK